MPNFATISLLVISLFFRKAFCIDQEASVCNICTVGVAKGTNLESPRLFHRPNGMGAGNLLYSMIHAAAYAFSRGWIYGGPLGIGAREASAVRFVFNAGEYFDLSAVELKYIKSKKNIEKSSDLVNVKGPPWESTILAVQTDDWFKLEKTCRTEEFRRFRTSEQVSLLDQLLPPMFISALQNNSIATSNASPLRFVTNGRTAPRVVIHIRRGGLAKGSFSSRKHTPDSYYFSIIEIIRTRYPNAEIHGFPALGMKDNAPAQNETEFGGYVKRNVTLHFDTDTVTAWAHMAAADVFVMAHSVYSSVPALLNPNCVVYDPFWFGKLERYLTIHTLKEKFSGCYKADPVLKPVKTVPKGGLGFPFPGQKPK